jgi:GT2 family glycosyltransferase
MSSNMISVIICSHNGAKKIAGALNALGAQETTTAYETIVVDDGSKDGTAEVAMAYGVHVVRLETNQGLSAARNAGIAAASGTIVAFCDDDCIPPSTWIQDLHDAWQHAGGATHGIGGLVRASETTHIGGKYADMVSALHPLKPGAGDLREKFRRYLKGPAVWSEAGHVGSLVGANMSFRRDSLTSVGGFDPAILFGGDETLLCERIRHAYGPHALLVIPTIVMGHAYHPSFTDTLRRGRAYGAGAGRDWAERGGVPTLLPGAILTAGGGVLAGGVAYGTFGTWAGGTVALLAFSAIPWLVAGWTRGRARGMLRWFGPYLRVIEEAASVIGFWDGWRRATFARNRRKVAR